MILTLHHAAWVGTGRDMLEADVVREGAEQRDTFADEHRQTTDDQAVDKSCVQKLLNGDSTVHVKTVSPGISELGHNL